MKEQQTYSFLERLVKKIESYVDPFHENWLQWHGLKGQFDLVKDMRDDYAIVAKNDREGLINTRGRVILSAKYEYLDFVESTDLLEGTLPNKHTQLINLQGRVLYEHPREVFFDAVGDRLLLIQELDDNGKTGVMTREGKLIQPMKFTRVFEGQPDHKVRLYTDEQWFVLNPKTGQCTPDEHNYNHEWEKAVEWIKENDKRYRITHYDIMEHLMDVHDEEEWNRLQAETESEAKSQNETQDQSISEQLKKDKIDISGPIKTFAHGIALAVFTPLFLILANNIPSKEVPESALIKTNATVQSSYFIDNHQQYLVEVHYTCDEGAYVVYLFTKNNLHPNEALVIGYNKKTHNRCCYDGKEYMAQPIVGEAE